MQPPAVTVVRFTHRSAGRAFRWTAGPVPGVRDDVLTAPSGAGVRVAVIDSGIEELALTAPVESLAVRRDEHGVPFVDRTEDGDRTGHGTLVGGIVRRIAPGCRLTSVRVFESGFHAHGDGLIAAVEWAIAERFPLINLSLSTSSPVMKEALHDLTDVAFFAGLTIIASAHNRPIRSFPWAFPSVISVGSHTVKDPARLEANPDPPVDFFALGVDIPGLGSRAGQRFSGNSFATPHVTGLCARLLEACPGLGAHELRSILRFKSANVEFPHPVTPATTRSAP
jgi:subtilisin family serine protease